MHFRLLEYVSVETDCSSLFSFSVSSMEKLIRLQVKHLLAHRGVPRSSCPFQAVCWSFLPPLSTCLVPFMSLLSLPRQCSCFCVSLQSVTVSVFVWCLSIRIECLNLCLSIHLSCCVFLHVSAVGLCVFFSKSVGMYIHTSYPLVIQVLGSCA